MKFTLSRLFLSVTLFAVAFGCALLVMRPMGEIPSYNEVVAHNAGAVLCPAAAGAAIGVIVRWPLVCATGGSVLRIFLRAVQSFLDFFALAKIASGQSPEIIF